MASFEFSQQTLITESAGVLLNSSGTQNVLIPVSAGVSIGDGQ